MRAELREAISRLGPSKGPTTLVLTRDLRLVLSALQEAREALGPFSFCGIPDWEDDEKVWMSCDGVELNHVRLVAFRRAAEVYRALSPGGEE